VQIFDSWASGLPEKQFADWVVEPTRRVVDLVRKDVPAARIIGFPRGATLDGYAQYASMTGIDAISIDTAVPASWAARTLAPHVAIQGNLDPVALVSGGSALDDAADHILHAMRTKRFIFNLGHGVVPETPVENVGRLVHRVRCQR
jgi:uroporphyrinogen decarboxylase